MRKSLLLMLPLCALISGCQTQNASNACAGWAMLSPNLDSSVYIATKDRAFANQVASHNKHGKQVGCWK